MSPVNKEKITPSPDPPPEVKAPEGFAGNPKTPPAYLVWANRLRRIFNGILGLLLFVFALTLLPTNVVDLQGQLSGRMSEQRFGDLLALLTMVSVMQLLANHVETFRKLSSTLEMTGKSPLRTWGQWWDWLIERFDTRLGAFLKTGTFLVSAVSTTVKSTNYFSSKGIPYRGLLGIIGVLFLTGLVVVFRWGHVTVPIEPPASSRVDQLPVRGRLTRVGIYLLKSLSLGCLLLARGTVAFLIALSCTWLLVVAPFTKSSEEFVIAPHTASGFIAAFFVLLDGMRSDSERRTRYWRMGMAAVFVGFVFWSAPLVVKGDAFRAEVRGKLVRIIPTLFALLASIESLITPTDWKKSEGSEKWRFPWKRLGVLILGGVVFGLVVRGCVSSFGEGKSMFPVVLIVLAFGVSMTMAGIAAHLAGVDYGDPELTASPATDSEMSNRPLEKS